MTDIELPICKFCDQRVKQGSFCWVRFRKDNGQGRFDHLFRYCSTCERRIGQAVPLCLVMSFVNDSELLPWVSIETPNGQKRTVSSEWSEGGLFDQDLEAPRS